MVLEVGVLEDGPGLAIAWAAVEEVVIVVGIVDAGELVGCWIALPCSEMMAGPSLFSCCRSWGSIFERTRSFTGCFEIDSE